MIHLLRRALQKLLDDSEPRLEGGALPRLAETVEMLEREGIQSSSVGWGAVLDTIERS